MNRRNKPHIPCCVSKGKVVQVGVVVIVLGTKMKKKDKKKRQKSGLGKDEGTAYNAAILTLPACISIIFEHLYTDWTSSS